MSSSRRNLVAPRSLRWCACVGWTMLACMCMDNMHCYWSKNLFLKCYKVYSACKNSALNRPACTLYCGGIWAKCKRIFHPTDALLLGESAASVMVAVAVLLTTHHPLFACARTPPYTPCLLYNITQGCCLVPERKNGFVRLPLLYFSDHRGALFVDGVAKHRRCRM